jgi:outer membrane protein TolC
LEDDRKDPEIPRLLAEPLTEAAAVRLALLGNRDLRAALHELGVARGRRVQAGLLPNPEIEVSLRRSRDKLQPLQADLGVDYDLTSLLLVPLRKGVAEADLAAERVRVAGEVLDTAYRARLAFYEVQARQQQLDLRARALSAYQASYATAEELHRVGNLPDMDLATERAAVEAARIEVAEAENALLDAREALNVALGLSGTETRWNVAAPLDLPKDTDPDADDAEKRAVSASFELQELEARAEAAARRVGLSRAEGNMPHVVGGFHGENDGFAWELGGHFTMSLPVFDRAQGRVMSAQSELGALRERYVATATSLRATVRVAQNRVASAGRRARHYHDALMPARKKALDETVLQYNAMQVSVFQLLEVQRRMTETAVAYVDTLLDYWKARAALSQILAGRHRSVALGPATVTAAPQGGGSMDLGAAGAH